MLFVPLGLILPWTDATSTRSETVEVNLPAAGLTPIDLTNSKLPPAGRYELSVTLRLKQATTSVPVDGVQVRLGVTVNA